METYFNIRYEFDREQVHAAIDRMLEFDRKAYICVSDGVILSLVHQDEAYRKVIAGAMFSICDSGWVPMYIKLLYGRERKQYSGSQIFENIIRMKRYRMMFLGTNDRVLNALRNRLSQIDPLIAQMTFTELPFRYVEAFDYAEIGRRINEDRPDIIWIALGAPKQEQFMQRLLPHINRGVMIAVGAAFNFFSGLEIKRAPAWMVRCKLEFLYRILCEPRKQLRRCGNIVYTLPCMLRQEYRNRRNRQPIDTA